jgi:transcriptional regulator with XRE-family HTH domain
VSEVIDAAALVREARSRQGISQAQLALRAGTSQHAVSLIERGLRQPSLATLERILLVTGHRLSGGLEVVPTEEDPVHLAAEQRHDAGTRVRSGFNSVRLFNAMHGGARR